MNEINPKWMLEALKCAEYAESIGEVPVGAVCVFENQIISKGYNQSISVNDPTAHAEVIAIRNAAKKLENYRLNEVDLYVTLEPCLMCSGAIVHSRIKRIIYATKDPKSGVLGSQCNIFESNFINHKAEIIGGILEDRASQMLKDFFKQRRQEKTNLKNKSDFK